MIARTTFLIFLLLMVGSTAHAQEDITLPEAVQQIVAGDTVTGELSADSPVITYAFEGNADDIVGINVEFDELDGFLWLIDPNGNLIARNDDRSSIFTSGLPAFQLQEDGTHVLAVSTYDYVTSRDVSNAGAFSLSLTTPAVSTLEIGDETRGQIGETASEALYFMEVTPGQLLSISVQSDDFDTQLFLDPAGGQDAKQLSNDDFGDSTNSQIGPALIAAGGRYVITVRSVFEDEAGDFTIFVSELSPTPLERGNTIRAEITLDSSAQFYAFEADAGEQIRIVAQSTETMNLALELFDPNGEAVAYSDDSGGQNPAIDYVIEVDGTYVIRVSPADIFAVQSSLGEYEITLTAGR